MTITRVIVTRSRDGWRLAFYEKRRLAYEEHFQTLDAALVLAPHIHRDRFSDDTRPGEDYYHEHTLSDQDL